MPPFSPKKKSILMKALNTYKTFLLIYRTTGCCNSSNQFDVRKSVHHHTIQINQPTRCNSFKSLLLEVYVRLNMFRAPLRPLLGAYNCTRSLWLYRCRVVIIALLVVVWQVMWRRSHGLRLRITCQTTTNNAPTASP
jgi:hypothetical protein